MIAFSLIEQTNVILSPKGEESVEFDLEVDSSVVHLDSLRMTTVGWHPQTCLRVMQMCHFEPAGRRIYSQPVHPGCPQPGFISPPCGQGGNTTEVQTDFSQVSFSLSF